MDAQKTKPRKKSLANHQRSWVWGRNAVQAAIENPNWPVIEAYAAENLPAEEKQAFQKAAHNQGCTFTTVPPQRLKELCHSTAHQGHLARLGNYPYRKPEELLKEIETQYQQHPPAIVIIDRMRDSYNFGALLRSAEAFGIAAVFIGQIDQTPVTSQTLRSSAGAAARIPIARTKSLPDLAQTLKKSNYRLIACTQKAEKPLATADLEGKVAFILGNEANGITNALLDLAHEARRIPQKGAVGSLNVAAAASVVFYEMRRQRENPEKT